MVLCALSGKPLTSPVVSSKSGAVFEKSAIEEYIEQHSQDPTNGEYLSQEDLIEIKPQTVVAAKSSSESIPALLQTFQTEYEALALETFELKKQLLEARKELSSTLYYHEAAVKVAAKLAKERDEAREALLRLQANGSGSMDVDKS
ncbi:Prp19/Pso4-like-domain-containing protein [Limtongia smithiae]|uniref:Prp19/Pso4-like-domain-containing protein n=1 Tax=Limtongia smithiae TaxID=1125753 RepID=UPI0034CF8312